MKMYTYFGEQGSTQTPILTIDKISEGDAIQTDAYVLWVDKKFIDFYSNHPKLLEALNPRRIKCTKENTRIGDYVYVGFDDVIYKLESEPDLKDAMKYDFEPLKKDLEMVNNSNKEKINCRNKVLIAELSPDDEVTLDNIHKIRIKNIDFTGIFAESLDGTSFHVLRLDNPHYFSRIPCVEENTRIGDYVYVESTNKISRIDSNNRLDTCLLLDNCSRPLKKELNRHFGNNPIEECVYHCKDCTCTDPTVIGCECFEKGRKYHQEFHEENLRIAKQDSYDEGFAKGKEFMNTDMAMRNMYDEGYRKGCDDTILKYHDAILKYKQAESELKTIKENKNNPAMQRYADKPLNEFYYGKVEINPSNFMIYSEEYGDFIPINVNYEVTKENNDLDKDYMHPLFQKGRKEGEIHATQKAKSAHAQELNEISYKCGYDEGYQKGYDEGKLYGWNSYVIESRHFANNFIKWFQGEYHYYPSTEMDALSKCISHLSNERHNIGEFVENIKDESYQKGLKDGDDKCRIKVVSDILDEYIKNEVRCSNEDIKCLEIWKRLYDKFPDEMMKLEEML